MRLTYTIVLLFIIPCVAAWASVKAIHMAVGEGARLLGDVWA